MFISFAFYKKRMLISFVYNKTNDNFNININLIKTESILKEIQD